MPVSDVHRRVAVAQIGCGYWGPNLLRNLARDAGCRLVAVAEPAAERRRYIRAQYPEVRIEAEAAAVVADPGVDAIVVATPAATHFALAKAAILAGKHVLVEKPLATTVPEVDELAELAVRVRRVLMVGHTFLYNDAVHELRRRVNDDGFGRIFYMHSQRLSLGQLRSDVNVWWNLAPHDLSILLFLMDGRLPKTISATGTVHLQPGIEDVVMASLVWDDETSAFVHVSWLDPYKVRRLTVVGSERMVVYDDTADYKLTVLDKGFARVPRIGEEMDFDGVRDFRLEPRLGSVHMPYFEIREPLAVEIGHFFDAIRHGKPPLTGAPHARDVVALLAAGERSLKAGGEPVQLGASP
jgi:predicted dehydrogenase